MNINSNIEYYDHVAENYNNNLDNSSNNEVRKKVADFFKSTVKDGVILDFGGGTGLDLEWLIKEKYKIYFCEPSIGMRSKAIDYVRKTSICPDITFLDKSDVDYNSWNQKHPFEEKVNAILANFAVINSINNLDLLFNSISTIINPGGHFIALILDSRFKTLMKLYLRQTLKSILFKNPIITYVNHNNRKHTTYIHSIRAIKKASEKKFEFKHSEFVGGYGFILIYLVRR